MAFSCVTCAASAEAQSLEPRAYSPAPIGLNFLVVGVSESKGGLSIDPSIPVTEARLSVPTALLGYARTVDFWGKSGKIDVIIPYGKLTGSALFNGAPVQRKVEGFGDPLFRVSMSLYGAPALGPAEFHNYKQDWLVGASLQVSVPLGQYDRGRLLNLGANRWFARPEIGVSKALGRWTAEGAVAATIYGSNKDFFGGRKRTQAPIYSAQAHIVYSLPSGLWGAVDLTYFTGGVTKLDGASDRNLQSNWRLGLTAAIPVTRRTSLKLTVSKGVSARTGNNFNLIALAWQYRWGAGI